MPNDRDPLEADRDTPAADHPPSHVADHQRLQELENFCRGVDATDQPDQPPTEAHAALSTLPDPAPSSPPVAPVDDNEDVEGLLEMLSGLHPPQPPVHPPVSCRPLWSGALDPYRPLLPDELRTVEFAHALLERGPYSLADVLDWRGKDSPGAVALYHVGDAHPLYELVRDVGSRLPLVIGTGQKAIYRLQVIAESLRLVGMGLEHFTCRILPLSKWTRDNAGKQLIGLYSPLWNSVDGVLSDANGADRRNANAERSKFDHVHREPGRPGAGLIDRTDDPAAEIPGAIRITLTRLAKAEKLIAHYQALLDDAASQ